MKKTKKFRVGIIGLGAIGSYVAQRIIEDKTLELAFVFDIDKEKTKNFDRKLIMNSIDELPKFKADLVVEAAHHKAVAQYAEKILKHTNLLVMSVGALADEKLEQKIKNCCKKYGTKFYIAPGAIIGLDGIAEVKDYLEEAELITRKPPKAFGRDDKEEVVLYDGNAREGCLKWPQNVNVAATLSLYGIGFDKTKLKIISDPNAKANTHTINASGSFGKFKIVVEAMPSKNPKTSSLAAVSCFEMIKRIQKGINLY